MFTRFSRFATVWDVPPSPFIPIKWIYMLGSRGSWVICHNYDKWKNKILAFVDKKAFIVRIRVFRASLLRWLMLCGNLRKFWNFLATIFIEGHYTKCIHLVNSKDLRNESNIFSVYRTYFSRQSIRNLTLCVYWCLLKRKCNETTFMTPYSY